MSITRSLTRPITRPLTRPLTAAGVGGGGIYSLLGYWQRPADTTAYLWRSYDTGTEIYEMWARTDDAGHFCCARFQEWTGSILTIGRLREGMIGTTVHHSNGAVVKTGTWANSGNAGTFGGSSSQSSTTGDTIACTVSGSVLGIRTIRTTNGGYATVAIDGDYTAADNLPAVTQDLIDAGKFQQAQLGHRYISTYATSPGPDCHILLTENAAPGSHTITVRATGTAAGGSGNRAYVAAFVGCTGSQNPGDSGTAMFYVRDVVNINNAAVSSMTLAMEFAPTGESKEDIVDNHGNETLVSAVWAVDGATVTPTTDQILSGEEITLTRVVDMTHSVTGTVATKNDVFSCRADRAYPIQYDWEIEWAVSGGLGFAYVGMLNHYTETSNGIRPDDFHAAVVGDAAFADFAYAAATIGESEETVMAFLDPAHDTVASVTVPDPAQSLAGWAYAGSRKAWFSDGATNSKLYFTRALGASGPTIEPITAGQITSGSCAWRTFRLRDAYDRLKGTFE